MQFYIIFLMSHSLEMSTKHSEMRSFRAAVLQLPATRYILYQVLTYLSYQFDCVTQIMPIATITLQKRLILSHSVSRLDLKLECNVKRNCVIGSYNIQGSQSQRGCVASASKIPSEYVWRALKMIIP